MSPAAFIALRNGCDKRALDTTLEELNPVEIPFAPNLVLDRFAFTFADILNLEVSSLSMFNLTPPFLKNEFLITPSYSV